MRGIDKKDMWIQTYTGQIFHFLDPDPATIDIRDIAHGLAYLCRFTGQTKKFVSVAEHSIRVAQLVPEEYFYTALMHDASEAYLGDISRPLKKMLPVYQDLELIVQNAIMTKFKVPIMDYDVINKADDIMLATEGRDLMGTTEGWYLREQPTVDFIEHTYKPEIAESKFLDEFYKHLPIAI